MKRSQDFIISVLSLTFCFLAAGVFQEDLYDDAEPFPHTEFFALIQVLTSYMTSAYLLNLSSTEYSHRKSLEKNDSSFDFTKKRTVFASFLENFKSSVLAADANQNSYEFKTFSATTLKLCHAFAYTAEIFVNNYALNYVSFTTHVLAKSCKVIPVLIGSILSNKAGRNMKQYVSVTLVAAGIFTFNYLDSESSEEDTLYGILLLALALGLDCASSFMVEKIRCLYSPSGLEIMHYCNLYGTFMTIPCYLYANSSQPLAILTFLSVNLSTALNILCFCFLSTLGQLFVFRVIAHFGVVTLTIITTAKKFSGVLLSSLIFQHYFTITQWVCILLVLFGSTLDFWSALYRKDKVHLRSFKRIEV